TAYFTLEELGQNVIRPPDIDGWPEPENEGNLWLSGGAMMSRMNLSALWAHGRTSVLQRAHLVPAGEVPAESADINRLIPTHLRDRASAPLLIDHLNHLFFPLHSLEPEQRRELILHWQNPRVGLDEETALLEMIRLMLATPEFQTQ
ncbi:MAG: DUF1800 family protein, partial [Verrucomicrobiota bacterium]